MRAISFAIIAILLFGNITDSIASSQKSFTGTLIDAHSQVRCDQTAENAEEIINRVDIDFMLLAPGGCHKNEKYFGDMTSHQGALAKVAASNKKIFYLAGMKKLSSTNKNYVSKWKLKTLNPALDIGKLANASYVCASEVIIQHAISKKDYGINPGTQLGLLDKQLEKVIKQFRKRRFPIVLHIELKDSEDKAKQTLADLDVLLAKHKNYPFVLNHVGQASPDVVADWLTKHKNLHFLLGQTSGRFQIGTRKQKSEAQNGWVSFFDVEGLSKKEHEKNPKWNDVWLNLVLANPEKFVMGYDLVFARNWESKLTQDVTIWRSALGQIDQEKASLIACGNAKRLWKLPIECKK